VVTSSNPLTVVVYELDAIKNEHYQLALWWGCGDGLAFQDKAVAMLQFKHSTAGGNPDSHA
jgi:hypothetical protein